MLQGVLVAGRGRFNTELRDRIRPLALRARTLLDDRLDPVAEHCARVGRYRVFDHPLVVINEESAHVHEPHLILALQELERAGDRVSGAAAQ